MRHAGELFHVLGEDPFAFLEALLDDPADLRVDQGSDLFRVVLACGEVLAQEYFIRTGVVDRAELFAEAVLGDHLSGHIGRPLDVVGRAGADVLEGQFLCHTAAQQVDDLLAHLLLRAIVSVFLGQGHGESARHAARHDGDLVDRVGVGQAACDNRMACFVERGEFSFLFADHAALLLGAGDDLGDGLFDLVHADRLAVAACGEQGRFVEHVLDVRGRESGRASCEHLRVDAFRQGLVARVDPEDLLSALDVGHADDDLAVKTAGTQQRRVEDVRTVGRRQDDDAGVLLKAVHLDEQLVEGLLSFVVAAAKSCAALSADRIDLIDEDDAGRILLGLVKEVADTARTDADEHLDELGAADGKERHAGFSGGRLRNVCLTCTGAAYQQNALGDPGAEAGKPLRVTEELDDLAELFLFFVKPGNILEGDLAQVAVLHQARLAAAELHRLAAASLLVHDHHPEEDEQKDHQQGREERNIPGRGFGRFRGELELAVLRLLVEILVRQDAVVDQRVDRLDLLAVLELGRHDHLVVVDAQFLDFFLCDVLHEFRVLDLLRLISGGAVVQERHAHDEREDQHIDPDVSCGAFFHLLKLLIYK